MIVAVRQVQGHCEYVDRNAKLDDGRAKCGEIHQQFRLKDMMDDKHIGDLRALETIQVSTTASNSSSAFVFTWTVLCVPGLAGAPEHGPVPGLPAAGAGGGGGGPTLRLRVPCAPLQRYGAPSPRRPRPRISLFGIWASLRVRVGR